MSTAVSFNSIRVGVLGRQRALWCRLSGRNTRNAPPLKGLTGRYVSKWPAKASKPQENCSCMVSDTQDSPAVDERSLVLLNSINDSAKWVVTLTAGGVLLWHHNVDVSWSLLGSIVTVFVCKVRIGPPSIMFWRTSLVQTCTLLLAQGDLCMFADS